jgi:hypothetical protein
MRGIAFVSTYLIVLTSVIYAARRLGGFVPY